MRMPQYSVSPMGRECEKTKGPIKAKEEIN